MCISHVHINLHERQRAEFARFSSSRSISDRHLHDKFKQGRRDMPQDGGDEDREVDAFVRQLNHGQHWHTFLARGIVSASATPLLLQTLVVAAHYYAVAVVGPSVARSSASSSSPVPSPHSIFSIQPWMTKKSAARGERAAIVTPFHVYMASSISSSSSRAAGAEEGEQQTKGDDMRSTSSTSSSSNLILTILSSDPATMLFDAAQLLMQDRMPPPSPSSGQKDQQQRRAEQGGDDAEASEADKPTCRSQHHVPCNEYLDTHAGDYMQDARLIMLPHTLGLLMLPLLLIPSLMAPSGAMVPGVGGRYQISL